MSRFGNSDNIPGMPGQVCVFCCLLPQNPLSYTHTSTHTGRENGRSAGLIMTWKEVAAVSELRVFRHLLTDLRRRSLMSLSGWPRKTTPKYNSWPKGLHTLAVEQSGEWPQCRGVTSTGGQTAGPIYQQMSFIFLGSGRNRKDNFDLSAYMSGSDYKDLAGKLW